MAITFFTSMNQMQIDHFFGLVVGTTVTMSAFHLPNIALQHHCHSGTTALNFCIPSIQVSVTGLLYSSTVYVEEICTIADEGICEHEECAIIEGSSLKVIQPCKQVHADWNDPINTSSVLHGPRGSGKGEIADEIVYRLPP